MKLHLYHIGVIVVKSKRKKILKKNQVQVRYQKNPKMENQKKVDVNQTVHQRVIPKKVNPHQKRNPEIKNQKKVGVSRAVQQKKDLQMREKKTMIKN